MASSDSGDSNAGGIVGGVLAGVVVFSIVCLLVVLYLYKRHRKQSYVVEQDDELKACMYSYIQYIAIV